MKTFLQTLFFFLLVTQICFTQWYQQNSGTTQFLWAVSFSDENNGTAVGDFGTILRTTDGGQNWISQTSGTNDVLCGVSFTDANNGTIVGWGGIYRTTDGGQNWITQLSGTTLRAVSFNDANNGTAVGDQGTILRTTNGGTTWTQQTSGTTINLRGVSFTDANNGTTVGGNSWGMQSFCIILRTTNGGTTWIEQSSPISSPLIGVSFTDTNNGTAVSGGYWGGIWFNKINNENTVFGEIIRTTDGGLTWFTQTAFNPGNNLLAVSFTDVNNGTAVGLGESGSGGVILRTTDGGTTWTQQFSGIGYLTGVSFIDVNNGWAVGSPGIILHTTNGGVPVELTSFTASANGKEVILNWSTATELNNQGFEIQRSTSGEEFFTVGFVNGQGTTTQQQNYSYADRILDNGNYYYRLKQVDYDGSFEYSDVVEVDFRTFNSYLLKQNYPNPFNPTTTIGFGIQNKSNVKITILNSIGEEVAVILNEEREPGFHQVEFNAANLPSGVYFYQLKAGSFIETKKMIFLK